MNHPSGLVETLRALTAVDLGRAVRSARQRRGMRQDDLAERLDVSRMTVSRLERGEAVSVETAMRALSECGAEVVVVPKFARVDIRPNEQGG